MTTPPGPRPRRVPQPLTVVSREWLSPALARLVMHAPQFEDNGLSDAYVKLLFDESGPILEDLPERPATRTYTVRRFDPANSEIWLDFVVHGDEGLAGPWAARCEPGDVVLANGPGGRWSPSHDAETHLFVGDESAIPAISAGLERLDESARGVAILETHEHKVEVPHPLGVEIQWIVRGDDPYRPERLAEAVGALDWDTLGDVNVFAHGERESMKALRAVFREREIPRERLSISGYWALGRVEQEFQAEKRTPIGEI